MRYIGTSATGTKHELEVEHQVDGSKFSLLGPTGKRHGSVLLSELQAVDMARHILNRQPG